MYSIFLLLLPLFTMGCAGNTQDSQGQDSPKTEQEPDLSENLKEIAKDAQPPQSTENSPDSQNEQKQPKEQSLEDTQPQGSAPKPPTVTEVDWSEYFEGMNAAAVLYDPALGSYRIYNPDLASVRRSPCSTFKIISSLAALETGVITPDDSTHTWSGEVFWNEDWNRDIDFYDAFRASCVWYFREVIDEIGRDTMQEFLDMLEYGNCDISDWEGRLNTNNSNPALTGFWVESSLKISPREQTEVLERIFGEASKYSQESREILKEAMLVEEPEAVSEQADEQNDSETASDQTDEQNDPEAASPLIYGKTGMGKAHGVTVDCWFAGFADVSGRRIYFCVYLGESDGADISSAKAKEIAIQIIKEEQGQ